MRMMWDQVFSKDIIILCLSTLVLLTISTDSEGQNFPQDCIRIEDSIARLACYDRSMQDRNLAVPENPANANSRIPQFTAPEAATVREVSPTEEKQAATGLTLPNATTAEHGATTAAAAKNDDFGLALKSSLRAHSVDSREMTVASATHNDFTGWKVIFTNGQTWKQVGTDRYRIIEGQSYLIIKATLNSFMLAKPGSRQKIRITRLE